MDLLNAVGIEHVLLIFADNNGDMGRGTNWFERILNWSSGAWIKVLGNSSGEDNDGSKGVDIGSKNDDDCRVSFAIFFCSCSVVIRWTSLVVWQASLRVEYDIFFDG